MKLLINICAHDGIMSHFAGVGTIVKRYIDACEIILDSKNIEYHINLITPKYNDDSFGFSKETLAINQERSYGEIIIIENGSNGKTAYGTPKNWQKLCQNTAKYINSIDKKNYDSIITIANDTPFANLLSMLDNSKKHYKIWIPHSTVKIHKVDSALEDSEKIFDSRLMWEKSAINYINNNSNCFLGSTGNYIYNHLIEEYKLNKEKSLFIPNGELMTIKTQYDENEECKKLFLEIANEKSIILSFGRAEYYKNLEATMLLADILKIKGIVVTKAYFKGQTIIEEYNKLSKKTNSKLYVDVPFMFPHYIINNFNKPIILLIPSKEEIVGLIINEIRKMNRPNVLIVANDIGGLSEQINSGNDGVLVDLENINESAASIRKYFNKETIEKMNTESQKKLCNDYNFERIFENFLKQLLGSEYE